MNDSLTVKIAEARQLLASGHTRKALILALAALVEALDELRDSLMAVHHNLSQIQPSPVEYSSKDPLLMNKNPRYFH
jgi:hypothetical protein